MSQPVDKPILVYNRIAENRRMTVQLVALFILLLLPATFFLTQYLWANLLTMGLISLPFLSGPGYTYVAHVIGMVIVGIAFSLAVIWWEFHVAERVTLKVAGARPLQPEEGRELRRTVENLCIGAGLPQPELYLAFAGGTNAFTVGLAPDRAKLVITRGLLELLDRRELEGVVAHELSHIGNQDIRLYTITAAMETLLRIPSQIIVTFFRALVRSKVGTFIAAVFAMLMLFYLSLIISAAHDFGDELQWWFYIALGLNVYVFLVGPLFGWMVRMAIARQREFLADADAVLLTRNPDALARALVKITRANDPETKVHPAMARMCIVDSQARCFSNHPPVEERIDVLSRMGSGISPQILEEAKKARVVKDGIVSGAINRPLSSSRIIQYLGIFLLSLFVSYLVFSFADGDRNIEQAENRKEVENIEQAADIEQTANIDTFADSSTSNDKLQDNLASEYVACAVYYSIASEAMKDAGEADEAADAGAASDYALTMALEIAAGTRTDEMAMKATLYRFGFYMESLLEEIDNDERNISIIANQYEYRCRDAINKPEEFAIKVEKESTSK